MNQPNDLLSEEFEMWKQLPKKRPESMQTEILESESPKLSLTPQDLESALRKYRRTFSEVEAECQSAVVTRRWASARMASPAPLFDELTSDYPDEIGFWHGTGRVQIPKRCWLSDPTETDDPCEHGFDSLGHLRTLSRIESVPGTWGRAQRKYVTNLLVYRDECIDELCGNGDGAFLQRYLLSGNRVQSAFQVTESDLRSSVYCIDFEWQGNRIVHSLRRSWFGGNGEFENPGIVERTDIEYDAAGQVSRIYRQSWAPEHQFDRTLSFVRPDGRSQQQIFCELEELLVTTIVKMIKEEEISEPLYCVMLSYGGSPFRVSWPCDVVLGTESIRRQIQNSDDPDTSRLWYPGEVCALNQELSLSRVDDPQLCELTLRSLEWIESDDGGPSEGVELLRRVAVRLANLDWQTIAPTTNDFVVYPVDRYWNWDVRDDMEACIPHERMKRLQDHGLINFS